MEHQICKYLQFVIVGVATNIQLGGSATVAAPSAPGIALNPQLGQPGVITNPVLGGQGPITLNPGFGAGPGAFCF